MKTFKQFISEGEVIQGPWKDSGKINPEKNPKGIPPGAEKLDVRDVFGPGQIEKILRAAGGNKRGHTFKEKPGYFEDFEGEYESLKYSTNMKAIKALRSHMSVPEYDARDLYTKLRGPQSAYENPPGDDRSAVYLLHVGYDEYYLCARYANTYCRFWMKVEEL